MQRNTLIKIYNRPKLNNPIFIAGWPGMGEISFKTISYLIDKLKAEEFAELSPEKWFNHTSSVIKNGIINISDLPINKFYFYKDKKGKRDIIFFLGSAQPELSKAKDYSSVILSIAREYKVKNIYGFASMPQAIDHTKTPKVIAACTHKEDTDDLKRLGIKVMDNGQITGMNGIFIAFAKQIGFHGVCLLSEIPVYTIHMENPKSSLALLRVLSKILSLEIDLTILKAHSDLFEEELDRLLDYIKNPQDSEAPIDEDEIQKIKSLLSQPSSLPSSISIKIEKMFELAKKDIRKAEELKLELDKWNVYNQYEDRFLDLFKKPKEEDN